MRIYAAAIILALGLAGVLSPEAVAASTSAQAAAPPPSPFDRNQGPKDYHIGPGDVLKVLTWKEADFSGQFAVRYDGKITIPFVGDVDVDGKTPTELGTYLEQQIGRFVESAHVTVAVDQPNSARFFVIGKVAQQGAFPYTGPLRVVQALALAGGFQEFAKLDQVFVIREVNGKLLYFPFSYDELVNKRQLGGNMVLMPGDTIVVP
jgi:polysaccharide biosynthesis/export protein